MRLENKLDKLDVDNVFIYVADAVRWDALSNDIARRGTVVKSVAASIHSPTSFASLVSGRYLPSHGVTDFNCRVPDSVLTLFDVESHYTRFMNSIGISGSDDPIYSVLNQPPIEPENPLDSVPEPFIIMERGQGGHAPYGDFEGTATEYFGSRQRTSVRDITREYYDGVQHDAETFLDRLDYLRSKNLLEDTLVIYTSDHGELLGEGGMFGHNGPIRPELVFVPTVFMHPKLDDDTIPHLFGHTSLLPTVLESLGINSSNSFDEPSLNSHYDIACSFYETQHEIPYSPLSGRTQFDSVWHSDGGYIYPRSSVLKRFPGFIVSMILEPTKHLARKNAIQGFRSYVSDRREFGSPPERSDIFLNMIDEWRQTVTQMQTSAMLTQDAQDRLEDLGYID